MGGKVIEIVLRAKNAMAAGLSKAGKSLKAFGAGAVKWGKRMAVGFLAAGTAVAGMAAKALAAYSVQERAEKQLEAAMNARGEQGGVLINVMKREAAAIQDATGAADENTLATMAQLSTLGVATSRLAEAAKATIALKSVGLEGASAQRAVALAMQGNFDMLQRYVPAIRNATSEQEKAAAFNDLVTRGYQQQEAELNTVGGQWNALKGRIGDVWEELGKAIAQNGALTGAMQKAGDAVKAFGEKVAAWVEGGGLGRLVAGFQVFFLDIRQRWQMMGNNAHVAFSAIGDGAATIGKYLGNLFGVTFQGMINQAKAWGAVGVAVFNMIRKPSREAFREVGRASAEAGKAIVDQYKNMAKAVATSTGIVTKRTDAALAERTRLQQQHTDEVNKLNASITAKMQKEFDSRSKMTKQQIADAEAAALAEAEAAAKKLAAEKKAAEEKLALEKKLADGIKKLEDEKKKAQIEAQQAVLDDAKKKADEEQKLAEMRVQEFIDAAKQEKDIAKDKAKEAGRAAELEGRVGRGAKLGRRDQEFLDAFRKIEEAKEGQAKHDLNKAQAEMDLLQGQQLRALNAIDAELIAHNAKLDNLLVMQ